MYTESLMDNFALRIETTPNPFAREYVWQNSISLANFDEPLQYCDSELMRALKGGDGWT